MHGRTDAQPGETIALAVDADGVHLFDPTSGATIAG